jgi:DNA polymerase-3 subunit delta
MITILSGENSFLVQQHLRQQVRDFVAEHGDMALEQLDGEEAEFDRMREALQSLPFLASKKLVVLRAPGANKQFAEAAVDLLTELPESTDLIIIEPKLDKRTAYFKLLKAQKNFHQYDELDANGLSRWLVTYAQEHGGTLGQSDARYLVERVGANQRILGNELKKLIQYNTNVTEATINLLTERAPQSTIFELLDSALVGNHKRTLELYQEQRTMKVEPQQILALLGWQLHILAVLKTAGERDVQVIAKEAKLNPYVVRKSQSIARRMSMQDLKQLIKETLDLDIRLKSESIDADDAIQNLLISIK